MNERSTAVLDQEDSFNFVAGSVTGSRSFDVRVQGSLSAGNVATSVAERMNLPANVAYDLRDDSTSRHLRDGEPIADQVAPDSHLTLVPKTHLGGFEARRR